MSDTPQRRVRAMPDRQLEDGVRQSDQLDLLDNTEEEVQTPEQLAEEHKRQIDELTRQAQADRAAKLESDRRAAEMADKAKAAQTDAFSAQEKAIASQLETQERLVQQAKASMRAARDAGDFDAEEKAMDSLTDAKVAISTLNNQKAYLETVKKQAPPPQSQQSQQSQPQQEVYRGRHGFSKASEEWIDKHPEFDSDPFYKTMVISAAQAAVQDGCVADSPQFFRFIETTVSKAFPAQPPQQQQQQQRPRPPASSVGAPQSRTGANAGASQQQTQQVNAAAVAKALNVTVDDLQQFAKINKMPLDKYLAEQVAILEEERRGQNTGLYRGETTA